MSTGLPVWAIGRHDPACLSCRSGQANLGCGLALCPHGKKNYQNSKEKQG